MNKPDNLHHRQGTSSPGPPKGHSPLDILLGSGIYGIADPGTHDRNPLDVAIALLDGGVRLIQLRLKYEPAGDFLRVASALRAMTRAAGAALVINDRIDIALAVEADGVHLGQTDIPLERARRLMGPGRMVGISTHTIHQIRDAISHGADYVGYGPVFGTQTKAAPLPARGVAALRDAVEAAGDTPVVAIGGINSSSLQSVLATGCQAAAVIGEITGAADMAAAVGRLRQASARLP